MDRAVNDGPTFFGPEGVTKGRATPVPAPPAPKPEPPPKPAPEPERKSFTEVKTANAPRRMSAPMWAALGALAACTLLASWFFSRSAAPKYDMTSTFVPLGRFTVTPVSFKHDKANASGVHLTLLLAYVGNASKQPQVASDVTVQLADDEDRLFDPADSERLFAVLNATYMADDRSKSPTNPGIVVKRGWIFTLPDSAKIKYAVFKDQKNQEAVKIEIWEQDIPKDWFN